MNDDRTGATYGRLKVLRRRGKTDNGHALWECKCACGRLWVVRADNLREEGGTRSCGCAMGQTPARNARELAARAGIELDGPPSDAAAEFDWLVEAVLRWCAVVQQQGGQAEEVLRLVEAGEVVVLEEVAGAADVLAQASLERPEAVKGAVEQARRKLGKERMQ